MRNKFALIILAFALLLTGCGGVDTPTSVIREMANNVLAITAVFNDITDEASAKAALPKIEAIHAAMRDVDARAKAMSQPSATEMAEIEAALAAEMGTEDIMKPLSEARAKLEEVFEKNPEVRKIIEPALKGMENDM